MNADGGGQTRVTNSPADDFEPAWSPDGQKLAFTSDRDGNREVYLMNADGSGQTNRTNNAAIDQQPDWQTTNSSADLALSLGATPDVARNGQPLTYTITVLDAGPSNATGVVVSDVLSGQTRFISASTTRGGTCLTPAAGATGTVTCRLGFLPAATSWVNQVVVKVAAKKTTITNTASVDAATPDPYMANNSATITTRVK